MVHFLALLKNELLFLSCASEASVGEDKTCVLCQKRLMPIFQLLI
ncbi:MAG: hypothetical protein U5L45_14625 [Saprospiraceae bacterium]|nr:hypothetical protein [Saprospiraceae bacterium]